MLRVFATVPARVLAVIAAATVVASAQTQPVHINGAGGTLPYPIYTTWFTEYAKVKPDVQINYLSIGSGAAVRQLIDQIVFFSASDAPMTEEELQEAPGRILHLPTVLGAVVPIYNLPEVKGELTFDGSVLADIYLGKIRNWNDPAIARVNNGLTLPPTEITVVSRADNSGSSFIWTDYLSKVSPEWKKWFGARKAINLPIGITGRGSEEISSLVKQTPGAIGYVELTYAVRLSGLDYQRAWQRCVPNFVVHVDPPLLEPARSAQ